MEPPSSDRETVKPTWSDTGPGALSISLFAAAVAAIVSILPLEGEKEREREAHPQRTISARTRYRY